MLISIRRSTQNDLSLLEEIERTCFPEFQQSSRRTLRLSLSSSAQEVWVAEIKMGKKKVPAGIMVLHLHPRTLRVFSIGVLNSFQGKGIGARLITHACNLAMASGYERISLEARSNDTHLIEWYEKAGFVVSELLPDYYMKGEDAKRMIFTVSRPKISEQISNIIVVDHPSKWNLSVDGVKVVSSKNYISDPEFQTNKSLKIFNLSNSYRYQSMGYYVSLLASARDHRAIPSVTTIRDFKNLTVIRSIANDIDELIQNSLEKISEDKFVLNIYFGHTTEPSLRTLGSKLYLLFETPLLQVHFSKTDRWIIQRVVPLSLKKIDEVDHEKIQLFASNYFSKKRFHKPRLKHYKYDLAILINPNEENSPSNPTALRNFKEVANKIGFYVDFITKDDYENLPEYDALFIRETTNVNDHTYDFARCAYAEGLVVIDDPWSILRCSNKIYMYERMKQYKVPIPQTGVLSKGIESTSKIQKMNYPIILKQPDSAFSLGVIKVNNADEMIETLNRLFKKSDLILAQEFLPSDFDWRIGVLDNTPLFACKYYMAKDHWQIYNWKVDNEDDGAGDAETVHIEDVPEQVLKVAVKAASLMGDGLYGVDLKMVGDKVYVIEVNDNPNIDAGIEDQVLGEEIYYRVMRSLFNRIEMSRNIVQIGLSESDN
jgi:glutathione synthase/RimK-type ligase-like ATP-grasp enzyme/ribosomal protein S18 acetylase RimI-like enzyme